MSSALLLDFTLNAPFQYLEDFKRYLRNKDIELRAIQRGDIANGLDAFLEEQFDECDFLVLRKPFAVLSGERMRGLVQDAVTSGRVGLLVMFSYTEDEALELMNEFLKPFDIQGTEFMVWDEEMNYNSTKKIVRLEAGSLVDPVLTEEVHKVIIPQPHHWIVSGEAKPLFLGNPSSQANKFQENPAEEIRGQDIVIGGVNGSKGRIVVMDSTPFTNNWVQHNKRLLNNIVSWLSYKE